MTSKNRFKFYIMLIHSISAIGTTYGLIFRLHVEIFAIKATIWDLKNGTMFIDRNIPVS